MDEDPEADAAQQERVVAVARTIHRHVARKHAADGHCSGSCARRSLQSDHRHVFDDGVAYAESRGWIVTSAVEGGRTITMGDTAPAMPQGSSDRSDHGDRAATVVGIEELVDRLEKRHRVIPEAREVWCLHSQSGVELRASPVKGWWVLDDRGTPALRPIIIEGGAGEVIQGRFRQYLLVHGPVSRADAERGWWQVREGILDRLLTDLDDLGALYVKDGPPRSPATLGGNVIADPAAWDLSACQVPGQAEELIDGLALWQEALGSGPVLSAGLQRLVAAAGDAAPRGPVQQPGIVVAGR